MTCLLVRLDGPLQAWGTTSRFTTRQTALVPSKSGFLGLVCAALGRRREESVAELAELRFAVRVDHPGSVLRDYHTAGSDTGIYRASGARGKKDAVLSERYYLQDASFLAALEGNSEILGMVDAALRAPRWPLYLGRRGCPPSGPVHPTDALRDADARSMLATEPWQPRPGCHRLTEPGLRVIAETAPADAEALTPDQPVNAAYATRTFVPRPIRTHWVMPPVISDDGRDRCI